MNDTLNQYEMVLTRWDGETETFEYRLPPLRDLAKYVDLTGPFKEEEMVKYLLKNEDLDLEQFTDDSVFEALDKVSELMDPRIAAWSKRQVAKLERFLEKQRALGLIPKSGTDSSPISSLLQDGALTESQTAPSLK